MTTSTAKSHVQIKPEDTRHLSEEVLQSAEDAVETTRTFAHESLDRATDKVRDLRRDLEPAIDQLASKAERLVRNGLGAVTHTGESAQKALTHYADATGRYVANQPVKSVLIAAATGAAVAALFMALHGRNRS
jgi:ElaB/YqjD/DUF883 family membrane-anchored ribosome-binding protein